MAVIRTTIFGHSEALIADTSEKADAFVERCEMLHKVLGSAVHPLAIGRLVQVWPQATAEVSYHITRNDGLNMRVTRVRIKPSPDDSLDHRPSVQRQAFCHPDDRFERRKGIRIALDRCLREAVRREDPARVEGRKRTL